MSKIKISEIEYIFSLIIEKLKLEGGLDIIIEEDFYKFIPSDEWASFTEDVVETGSLGDDIENLKKLSSDKNRPCTFVDFDRLASLLRAISQVKNPV